jgi:putative transposase
MSRRFCETWEKATPDSQCSHVTDISPALSYDLLMTRDLQRFYGGRDLHFLTFSCYQRQPLFSSASRCDLFLKILERVRLRYRLVVLGYVVMPEHVHLLVGEPQRETLSTAIQALKLGVVRSLQCAGVNAMSRKPSETWGTPSWDAAISSTPEVGASNKPNRFWQARFYDFNVFTEKKRIEKLRYIHRNPVARGLVASPEQWRWSSFRWYLSGEVGPVRINDTDILMMTLRPPAA